MDTYCCSIFNLNFPLTEVHLQSHEICFINIFDSFIFVIVLNAYKFSSPVLFGTPVLLDK